MYYVTYNSTHSSKLYIVSTILTTKTQYMYVTPHENMVLSDNKSKEEGKAQESIQSNTTTDLRHHIGK